MKTSGVRDGSTLLVAVSGGADSVALLRLLAFEAPRRSLRLIVAHLDHAVRPDSSADAAWVAALAAGLGLPLHAGALPAPPPGRNRSEERLRIARRRWLRRVAREVGAEVVALAHTRDDQAETLLLNLLRGTGLRGLTGMAVRSGTWYRPLLGVGRPELRRFLERHGQPWREDPTNRDPGPLRNRVRLRLIPLLESEFNPGAVRVLARNADVMRPVRRFLEREIEIAWRRLSPVEAEGVIRLERPGLASYDRALLEGCLRSAYVRISGTARDLKQIHLQRLTGAVLRGRRARFELPRRVRVEVDRGTVTFRVDGDAID